MKAKLVTLAIMGAMCEAALPQAMQTERRWRVVAKEPAPELARQRMDQAEAKRARKAQIRRGQK